MSLIDHRINLQDIKGKFLSLTSLAPSPQGTNKCVKAETDVAMPEQTHSLSHAVAKVLFSFFFPHNTLRKRKGSQHTTQDGFFKGFKIF